MNNTIPREVAEGLSLLNTFYGFDRDGDPDQYLMKEAFREDMYRVTVIHFHLAIEDLVKGFLYQAINQPPRRRIFSKKENVEYIQRLQFGPTVDLAARLHILSKRGHEELVKLNTIRNQCSHNWTLHTYRVVKQTKRAPARRQYKVQFKGRNLLNSWVFQQEFMPLYADIYLELFCVYYGIRRRHRYTDRGLVGPSSKKL